MKRVVLMIIPALICGVVFSSCGSDKAELTEKEGIFVGTYSVTYLSPDPNVNGTMTLELKNGKYSVLGFLHNQAEFSGDYSISDNKITFDVKVWKTDYIDKDGMTIAFDFDTYIVPQGEYICTFDGSKLKFSKTHDGFGHYQWEFTKK